MFREFKLKEVIAKAFVFVDRLNIVFLFAVCMCCEEAILAREWDLVPQRI